MIEHLKQTKAGFTLVELIVVIAILAILSGIAIPVYSGYISKANEAADLQLLSAVNTAWAAACADRGLDPTRVVGLATLNGEPGNKTISNITANGSGAVALSGGGESFNDAFLRYYGDNINTPFKVYNSLGYDMANGVFVDGATEYTFETAYGTVTITAAQLSTYQASRFAEIGSSTLTSTISSLVDKVLSSDTDLLISEEIKDYIENTLHMDFDTMSPTQKANALVLFASSGMDETTLNGLKESLAEGGQIVFTGSRRDVFSKLSAMYAMATAYASTGGNVEIPDYNSSETGRLSAGEWRDQFGLKMSKSDYEVAKEKLKEQLESEGYYTVNVYGNYPTIQYSYFTNPPTVQNAKDFLDNASFEDKTTLIAVLGAFQETSDFQSYMAGQGSSDLDGYMAAMNIINSNASSLDTDELSELLSTGFNDKDFNDMLKTILGS